MEPKTSMKPHVLIYPLPIQCAVNCMMKLAEMLCMSGVDVTFLITEFNHERLTRNTDVLSRIIKRYSTRGGRFQFETIPDGLPDDHPRPVEGFVELFMSLKGVAGPYLREKLESSKRGDIEQAVTSVICEGYYDYAIDVAVDVGVPVYAFETISPSLLYTHFCLPKLVEEGELPVADEDLDKLVKNVPGMESFCRFRDLPTFCRGNCIEDPNFQISLTDLYAVQRANGLILNTFQDLDDIVVEQLKRRIENVYAIGPVHHHLQARLECFETQQECKSSNSFWKEDDSCIKWLDGKAPKSVIYVSFGSLVRVTKTVLMEFWHGLVDSGALFLWVIRPDFIVDEKMIDESYLKQLEEGTEGRGYFVNWAPQLEILRHKSVGGILTHSGWATTLESIVEGVPMVCWPCAYDHHPISRFVSEVWKLGFEMKDVCERSLITTMVKEIMDTTKNGELRERAARMKNLANKSVSEGGSSYHDVDRLVRDITSFSQIK